MMELTVFEKIVAWFKSLFARKKISDEAKREMCKRAINSRVCPCACDICAWNVLESRK